MKGRELPFLTCACLVQAIFGEFWYSPMYCARGGNHMMDEPGHLSSKSLLYSIPCCRKQWSTLSQEGGFASRHTIKHDGIDWRKGLIA